MHIRTKPTVASSSSNIILYILYSLYKHLPHYHHLYLSPSNKFHKQAEISALENAGRLPASAYKGATMYTTLSPCDMCTGACILYKIPRVVLGENKTFLGGESYLKQRGVEVVNVESKECEELMSEFIRKQPEDW
jgi:tRNA(Arg) A34 adenosine deaminase TadA